jgi:hypothetical protein
MTGFKTLDTPAAQAGQGPRIISNKKLVAKMKSGTLSPDIAARLAYDINVGNIAVVKLPAKLSRMMTGTTVAGLAAERRKNKPVNGNGKHRVLYKNTLTDSDIDSVVTKIGPEKVMQSLDRITRPVAIAAE